MLPASSWLHYSSLATEDVQTLQEGWCCVPVAELLVIPDLLTADSLILILPAGEVPAVLWTEWLLLSLTVVTIFLHLWARD